MSLLYSAGCTTTVCKELIYYSTTVVIIIVSCRVPMTDSDIDIMYTLYVLRDDE